MKMTIINIVIDIIMMKKKNITIDIIIAIHSLLSPLLLPGILYTGKIYNIYITRNVIIIIWMGFLFLSVFLGWHGLWYLDKGICILNWPTWPSFYYYWCSAAVLLTHDSCLGSILSTLILGWWWCCLLKCRYTVITDVHGVTAVW